MQRKWRTNRGALDTVRSYPDFRAAIPPRGDTQYNLADPTDLYAVYTVLHIEGKAAELRWSPHAALYYFLAQWEQAPSGDAHVAAPEGDEDPPPQVAPEGSEAALQQHAAEKRGAKRARQQQQQQQQQQQGEQQQPGEQQQLAQPSEPQQQAAAAQEAGQQARGEAAEAAAAAPATAPVLRTQIVVPVSSACHALTPCLLQRFFDVRGVQAQQLLLALVDSNGVVTRSCLYNYIQAPLEGPGTANLELLDD